MKISLNWIREYVDLPEDLTIEKLSYDLTMRTVEVEGYESLAEVYENIVVGKIIEVNSHPKADRLRVVITDTGEESPAQIVCGGSNLEPGQMVVVAKPGSKVVWHGEGEPIELKISKLRGVESYGMICSANEVGLEPILPAKNDDEIVDLKGIDCKPGDNIATVLNLDDYILEIDNKSLTNRPDLWGHYGIARELSAIYKKELKPLPEFKNIESIPKYPVNIENSDLCRRFAAIVYSNVKNEPSPLWLKACIHKVGMRPINSLVDITNYIMLAVGQPTHSYDKNHVKKEINVRNAYENEEMELLDGKKLHLDCRNLVIADESESLGLAGIMGGKKDSILPDTTEIILEMANFSPACIRHTSQKFGLRTEASNRYEKDIDTQRIDQGLGLAIKLFKDILPDSKITAFNDIYPIKTELPVINVNIQFLSTRLGSKVTANDVREALAPLGFNTEVEGENLKITAPSWRGTGDISLPNDILEEVARMIGYENFDFITPSIVLNKPIKQLNMQLDRSIREYLAYRCGFQEIFTYPWVDEKFINAAEISTENSLTLANPPSPETRFLRSTLVPGIMETIATNLRYFNNFKVFELTQIFKKGAVSPSSTDEVLPLQERYLTGALTGNNAEELFFDAKGVLESMSRYCHMEGFTFIREIEPTWADKKVWLNIAVNNEIIGSIGLLSTKANNAAKIKRAQSVVFELNVEKLIPLSSRTNVFHHIPMFPLVEQDLSILVDKNIKWSDIETLVKPIVKDIEFIEEYRGKQVPEGKKSLMFRVHLGSNEGTLTNNQIESKMKSIIKMLNKQFEAVLREA